MEALFQTGHVGDQAIRAWTVPSDTGFTFTKVPSNASTTYLKRELLHVVRNSKNDFYHKPTSRMRQTFRSAAWLTGAAFFERDG